MKAIRYASLVSTYVVIVWGSVSMDLYGSYGSNPSFSFSVETESRLRVQ